MSIPSGAKRVLLVLFVPSVERDGVTQIDQQYWVGETLETLGRVFGGATAFPKARGVWRDDERAGALIFDETVIVQSYAKEEDVNDDGKLAELSAFCKRMGREAKQGEIGLVIGDEYLAITKYEE